MIKSSFYLLFLAIFLLAGAGTCSAAQTPPREIKNSNGKIALFPFENFSDERGALILLMPVIRRQLEKKGFDVLDEDALNKFLLRERVRSTAYVSRELARKLSQELNVTSVLLGSVNSFSMTGNPVLGLSARLVDCSDGLILWANLVSATGDDFTGILGLGRIESIDRLIPVVTSKLFASFSVEPPDKEIESSYKVAVMPFQNKSKAMFAGMIATYMTLVELFKSNKFIPVEYGDIRKSIVDLRVRQRRELDYPTVAAFSDILGVDVVLVGVAEAYSDRPGASIPPDACVSMRLIDARRKKILWYDNYQMGGDDEITVFDWGKMRSVDKVADKVIAKLIKKMEKSEWH